MPVTLTQEIVDKLARAFKEEPQHDHRRLDNLLTEYEGAIGKNRFQLLGLRCDNGRYQYGELLVFPTRRDAFQKELLRLGDIDQSTKNLLYVLEQKNKLTPQSYKDLVAIQELVGGELSVELAKDIVNAYIIGHAL